MITSLSINNYALIEKLAIDFSSGFTTITGETGAGKSILLGALGLVLGKRADLSSLKNKEEKCIIEAQFAIANYHLQAFFDEANLDYEDHTIIRREILPSGKSRAFVNDTPVNLQELQDLSVLLLDIHSQHETQELSDEKTQFQIIDAVAQNQIVLAEYQKTLKIYKATLAELHALEEQKINLLKEQDYHAFLLYELQAISLDELNLEELETQAQALENVSLIKENLAKSYAIADQDAVGILAQLTEMKADLQRIAGFSAQFQQLQERVSATYIELKDIVAELASAADLVNEDPAALARIQEQLQQLYSLQKKHQVQTIPDLIAIRDGLSAKVATAAHLDETLTRLVEQKTKLALELDQLAATLHQNRVEAIPNLVHQWTTLLADLGMPAVRFEMKLVPTETYLAQGKENLHFLFSANAGSDLGLLKKVASGGEMSRIMLATKAILANYTQLPTLIFDEIDTGVSGEIATKMAAIMQSMSASRQVFAITHLPQIAAKGQVHYKVYKEAVLGSTQTQLKQLSAAERIIEIAEMLSGKDPAESAINHAKALLN
ncbi:MAG: DNA repair protein RecN [Flavobacterium sp.]|nr:DNA repair protein RecN [Flavobacterium sp.]